MFTFVCFSVSLCFCPFLSVSSVGLPNVRFVSHCEKHLDVLCFFFGIFVVPVASLNVCCKVICGSRLARHVIDDANRGCRAKIT